MYSKTNPPKYTSHMRAPQEVRDIYDFGRLPDHTLTIVKNGKRNFNEMAAAAADGCDFKAIHDTLRQGNVRLSRSALENTVPKGAEYRDTTNDPASILEADQKIKAAAAAVMESYEKLPSDLRGNMSVSQFAEAVKSGYLERYADFVAKKEGNNNASE